MKGIKVFTGLAALTFMLSISMHIFAQSTTITVDTTASTLNWKGEKVTGNHVGTIKIKSGELVSTGSSLTGGTIVIDMSSIVCTDLNNEDYNAKLIGHLESEDFFYVEKHPTASSEITKVESIGDNKVKISGNMTIRGNTNEESFDAVVNIKDGKLNANGTMKIDRTKYKVEHGSGSIFSGLGDKMIYDEFTLEFRVVTLQSSVIELI